MSISREILVQELGNWIEQGTIIYNNVTYNFSSYYYEHGEYVMINYGKEHEDGECDIEEVGRISGIAVKCQQLDENTYIIENI